MNNDRLPEGRVRPHLAQTRGQVRRAMAKATQLGALQAPLLLPTVQHLTNILVQIEPQLPREGVHHALNTLAGRSPSPQQLGTLFWRILSDVQGLRRGRHVSLDAQIRDDEPWAPARFLQLFPTPEGGILEAVVVYGYLTGLVLRRLVDPRAPAISRLVWRMGYEDPGIHPLYVVGSHAWVQVAERAGEISFHRCEVDESLAGLNRQLRQLRTNKRPCRYTWPCWQCCCGYDRCAAACRPVTLLAAGDNKDVGQSTTEGPHGGDVGGNTEP